MGKSKGPDYGAAAQQQGTENRDTAVAQSLLNNPNMVTPYGTQTYTGAQDGSGRGTLTQSLSPAEQDKLDRSNQIQSGALGILGEDMPNIRNALLSAFGLSGSASEGYLPGSSPGRAQTDADWGSAGPIQSGLDFSGLPGIPQADAGVRDLVSKNLYQQGAQFLDPQFKNLQDNLDSTLANQGIVRNPDEGGNSAWQKEQDNLARQRTAAYGDLGNRSVIGGGDAMNQLFEMQMGSRQQGVGEISSQGQFANSAQGQAFNDILNAMQGRNAGIGLQGQLASNEAGLYNSGRQQNYTEMAQNRTMPLNMLNAMLSSSQVNNPQFQNTQPTAITPAPIMQGAQLAGQANTASNNATAGLLGSIAGGVGTIFGGPIGGMAATAATKAISDRRLKTEIRQINRLRNGLPWYSFKSLGVQLEGVMADEVEKVFPHAVSVGPGGFNMVDYALLGE